nr:nero [Cucujiformia]
YCFGQMQDETALDILINILNDQRQEPMVRHEAAEALGAIGSERALQILQEFKNDAVTEVAETCELALDRIDWLKHSKEDFDKMLKSPFNSVDPAPPALSQNITELKSSLCCEDSSLFNRYRAMFALRNIGSEDAVKALGEALKCGSALFKHEIAFVLGQLQHPTSISYLRASLEDNEENEMVRHECA